MVLNGICGTSISTLLLSLSLSITDLIWAFVWLIWRIGSILILLLRLCLFKILPNLLLWWDVILFHCGIYVWILIQSLGIRGNIHSLLFLWWSLLVYGCDGCFIWCGSNWFDFIYYLIFSIYTLLFCGCCACKVVNWKAHLIYPWKKINEKIIKSILSVPQITV